MSASGPDLTDIDAAIAKGEWWLRLLEELAETGVAMARELVTEVRAGRLHATDAAEAHVGLSAAVRQAIAMSQRIEQALRGLNALRECTLEEIAAAKAKAQAHAEAAAAAREKARAQARARREARKEEVRALVMAVIDREAADAEEHEKLSLALDQRLSFDPAYTDIDSLPLHQTVERICADLKIVPDWRRWEAGDWKPRNPGFQHTDWPIASPDQPSLAFADDTDAGPRPANAARLE
jgi:hypothetical protein